MLSLEQQRRGNALGHDTGQQIRAEQVGRQRGLSRAVQIQDLQNIRPDMVVHRQGGNRVLVVQRQKGLVVLRGVASVYMDPHDMPVSCLRIGPIGLRLAAVDPEKVPRFQNIRSALVVQLSLSAEGDLDEVGIQL